MNLFKLKTKNFLRSLVHRDFVSILKFAIGIIVIMLFSVGTYFIFYGIFKHLKHIQDIGPLIADKTISIGFLAFFFMLLISNAIGSTTTLFRSQETHFLLSKPIPFKKVFSSRFSDNLFYSSWATLILCVPLLISYSNIFDVKGIYIFFIVIFGLLPFIIIPAYFGSTITILLFLITKKIGFRNALTFILLIGGAVLLFFLRTGGTTTLIMNLKGDIRLLNYYLQNLATASNPVLPNVWLLELLRSAKAGNTKDFIFWASLLTSTAIALWVFMLSFVNKAYYPAYLSASEIIGRKKQRVSKEMDKGFLWDLFSPFPINMRTMMVKDFRLFVRDTGQWSQFIILVVLLILYLVNLRLVPLNINSEFWRTVTSFSNFAFTGYILATLSVRFVFPSISMEGRSLWCIMSSPMPLKNLFWAKFISAFLIFFLLAELVAVVSNIMLAQSGFMMILTASGISLMSISLTSLSVGLGALFPSFDETNPARIASSGGGMITALISLTYVILMVMILALPTYKYTLYLMGHNTFPRYEIVSGFLLIILLNIIATYLPIKLGMNSIKKRNF